MSTGLPPASWDILNPGTFDLNYLFQTLLNPTSISATNTAEG